MTENKNINKIYNLIRLVLMTNAAHQLGRIGEKVGLFHQFKLPYGEVFASLSIPSNMFILKLGLFIAFNMFIPFMFKTYHYKLEFIGFISHFILTFITIFSINIINYSNEGFILIIALSITVIYTIGVGVYKDLIK